MCVERVRFICISGITGTFLKMPPPFDMLLLTVVPAEIGPLIAVMERELRAGTR